MRWLDGITVSMDMSFSSCPQGDSEGQGSLAVHRVTELDMT